MHRGRLSAVLVLMALTGFLTTLDNTVINVALPTVRAELGLDVADLEWVAASYVLSFGTLLLAGGRVADLAGRRAVMAVGVVVFTVSSCAAALADSGTALMAARAVQGAGAALIVPASLAVVARDLPPRRRATAIGLWTASLALALALGPVIGGFVSTRTGMASGLVSAAREISGVFGVVLVGIVLTRTERDALADGVAPHTAFLDGYDTGLRLAAGCVLLGAVVSVVALRRPGRHRRGAA
ncbi:MFS transporter [Streptomyces althioticus]|uniref:MFS transporter n=1 Tax=Streptomyces althioticus TaxID=83380 RepID=UPI0037CDE78E